MNKISINFLSIEGLRKKLISQKTSLNEKNLIMDRICEVYNNNQKFNLIVSYDDYISPNNIDKLIMSMKSSEINLENRAIISILKDENNHLSDKSINHLLNEIINAISKGGDRFWYISDYQELLEIIEFYDVDSEIINFISNKISTLKNQYLLFDALKIKKFKPYYEMFISRYSELLVNVDCRDLYLEDILWVSRFLSDCNIRTILNEIKSNSNTLRLDCIINNNVNEGEEYYSNLISLIFNMGFHLKNVDEVNINKLPVSARHMVVEYLCSNINDSNIIFDYCNKYNLDNDEIKLAVDKLIKLRDKNILIKIMDDDRFTLYYDDIFETLASIDDICYYDIHNIPISKLNDVNKKRYIEIVIENDSYYELLSFSTNNKDALSDVEILKITKKICKCGCAEVIYLYAFNMQNFLGEEISNLVDSIIKRDDIKYSYLFLINIVLKNSDDIRKLKMKILNSYNMKYICLLALFVDSSLIVKLFENVNKMYEYMISSKMYNDNELKEITSKIYGNCDDVNYIELQAKSRISEINFKTYEMINNKNNN